MRWQQYRELAAGLETIEDFWRYGQSRFSRAGIDCSQGYQTPQAEAAALVARRLVLEPEELPDQTFDPIAPHGLTDLSAHRQPKTPSLPGVFPLAHKEGETL